MTPEQQAKIHEYAGCRKVPWYNYETGEYDLLWQPLTGDYADVVAMKCFRKLLASERLWLEQSSILGASDDDEDIYAAIHFNRREFRGFDHDLAQAIFAAVLAYLEQKGK